MDTSMDICNVTETRVLVPFDKNGQKSKNNMLMWLDLSKGQKIRLNPNHNCQEAMQPVYMHIGASKPHTYRGSVRQPGNKITKFLLPPLLTIFILIWFNKMRHSSRSSSVNKSKTKLIHFWTTDRQRQKIWESVPSYI